MERKIRKNLLIMFLVLLMAAVILGACGSANKEAGTQSATSSATRVGSDNCTTACHAGGTPDLGSTPSAPATWNLSLHASNPFEIVDCETCHGGGSLHYGSGPIPTPVPHAATCAPTGLAAGCHETFGGMGTSWGQTQHANADNLPDRYFFQGGTGIGQASGLSGPEFVTGSSPSVPVTINQHIEECSVCHNSNQRFDYDANGNYLRPGTAGLVQPEVGCPNCHDAHNVATLITVPTRTDPIAHLNLRRVKVNANGANDANAGTWSMPLIYQTNGAVQENGSVAMNAVIGTNNELSVEKLCGSCHTKGTYKYGKSATHQQDIYSQWKASGHGDRNAPAFAEFSANPTAYFNPNTLLNYTTADAGHQSLWPYDMRIGASNGGAGVIAVSAATWTNAAVGGTNDNYQCYKCHNGLTSIAYQEDVQGTAAAPVVFGDEPVTCITCHDPHQNSTGMTNNVRKPVTMTKYYSLPRWRASSSAPYNNATTPVQFSGNVFLDGVTSIPTASMGNSIICVFCHQGRESGYTLYWNRLELVSLGSASFMTTNTFFNSHYLGTGAMLWGVNGYEYAGKQYSVNAQHQAENCVGCHMGNPDTTIAGGHTWIPNVDPTCNTSACHGIASAVTPSVSDPATYRSAGDANDYTGNGSTEAIADAIKNLQDKLIYLLSKQTPSPVYYDDTQYPYFFTVPITTPSGTTSNHATGGSSIQFKPWTPVTLKAAFNLNFAVKGLPSAGGTTVMTLNTVASTTFPATSQTLVPNVSAAVHNYQYVMQLLMDSIDDLVTNGTLTTGAVAPTVGVRPVGIRPAVDYGGPTSQ